MRLARKKQRLRTSEGVRVWGLYSREVWLRLVGGGKGSKVIGEIISKIGRARLMYCRAAFGG